MAGEEAGAVTIEALLESGAIVGHKDGNHGSQYPRAEEFRPVGVPFLTAKSLSDGKIDIAGAPRLAEDRADALRFGFVQPGDVLLSHNATVGRVAVVPEFAGRMLIGTSLTYFRVDPEKISPRYLAAYFSGKAFQDELAAVMSHSTRNQVPITAQRRLRVVLPSLPAQRAIAHILGTLDDKIELNRRMNETLEAMARALFKSWFVDFDPVRAKAGGRDTGLPAHVADLFPDSLEDSELGEIPKWWTVGSVYDIADVIYGAPFASSEFNTDAVGEPLIRIRDLPAETPGVWTKEVHPKGYRVCPGDILVGMDGEFRAFLWGGAPGWLNQRICAFTPRERRSAAFVRNSIVDLLADVEATEAATTVIHLGKADIDRFRVIRPHPDVAAAFDEVGRPLYAQIVARKREVRTLASLRDALLPKLVSGELRVDFAPSVREQKTGQSRGGSA